MLIIIALFAYFGIASYAGIGSLLVASVSPTFPKIISEIFIPFLFIAPWIATIRIFRITRGDQGFQKHREAAGRILSIVSIIIGSLQSSFCFILGWEGLTKPFANLRFGYGLMTISAIWFLITVWFLWDLKNERFFHRPAIVLFSFLNLAFIALGLAVGAGLGQM